MRYIDADKYKADLLVGQEYLDENTLLTAVNLLDCQPTADVPEVRHGRWEKRTFVGYGGEIKTRLPLFEVQHHLG